jgi:hypothetical protein
MRIQLSCTPFEQIVTVGLTKCVFVQYFIIQNCKNSNTNFFLQISTRASTLNFCMHAHIMISSLYKNFHN